MHQSWQKADQPPEGKPTVVLLTLAAPKVIVRLVLLPQVRAYNGDLIFRSLIHYLVYPPVYGSC